MPPLALTMTEAAQVSGLSRTALYEALNRRELVARKSGRRTLIGYADLQAYLASLPTYPAAA